VTGEVVEVTAGEISESQDIEKNRRADHSSHDYHNEDPSADLQLCGKTRHAEKFRYLSDARSCSLRLPLNESCSIFYDRLKSLHAATLARLPPRGYGESDLIKLEVMAPATRSTRSR